MNIQLPEWLDPAPWVGRVYAAADVEAALATESPGPGTLAALLSPAGEPCLERMAQAAQAMTRRQFGRTISLYAPLYLSNYCASGCVYCGFASTRDQPRHKLGLDEMRRELEAMRVLGLEEVLLLTGERTPEADFDYVEGAVQLAASMFHYVSVEVFPMTAAEYARLAAAGCTGVTLYQETYDPVAYDRLHAWGPKKDFLGRLEAPGRALEAGIRAAGLAFLIGLSEPITDAVALYQHVQHLRKRHWKCGISVSFPRLCGQEGGFEAPYPVSERFLARLIYAFRICLPDVPLVLSTRERPAFRDGLAGVGISKMSVASRTTVGGYWAEAGDSLAQFDVNDGRDVGAFCAMLKEKGLQPVFKNWDAVYR